MNILTFNLSGLKLDTTLEVEMVHLGQMSGENENVGILARAIKDENIIISTRGPSYI